MISFVIPALESDQRYLWNCLDSLIHEISTNGTGKDEVIVVVKLGRSTEKKFREKILKKYGKSIKLKFSTGNRSVAKNYGLQLAKNNIITFLDADTIISKGFIRATLKRFNEGYAYVNYSARPLDEEVADKRRLFYYARYLNLNQWFYTLLGNKFYRPYGFCMSVRKDFCEAIKDGGDMFLERLAGHGEDSEFGRRYGRYCRRRGVRGKYERNIIVKTSFREWYVHGASGGLKRVIRNVWEVPYRKKPVANNWRE
jgi:glycosyltransferase involved in cell wall biosynthesis